MTPPGQRLLSFPLGGPGPDGLRPWSEGAQSVREVLMNILLTRPGERLMRPEFGAGLETFIHQPNNQSTRQIMADVAKKAIQRNEPRVDILDIDVRPDPSDAGVVLFSLIYRMRVTGAEDRLDLSLSLAGGG